MSHIANETPWEPSQRYPEPRFRAFDPSFLRFRVMNSAVQKLAGGCAWAEGPVWFGDQRALYWSDIPNDRILRWDEATEQVAVFRKSSNNANGNTRDRQGRLVTCEHLTRRITRTEYDGSITVLADRYDGKRLNSPNDVVVKSDGSIWFTDPTFGIAGYVEGEKADPELPHAVYRVDGQSGAVTMVTDALAGPNGLAFSADEKILYIVESRAEPRRIVGFDVAEDGRISNQRTIVQGEPGDTPDGFRIDTEGNLWCGWGMGDAERDGVRVFSAEGKPLGHIDLPERCANLCFGGRHRNRLFMASSRSIYAVYVNAQGLAGG
ncbi:SMP-30/gluconolactonase/LRE family protein [Pseudoroseomonas cervicalis]|uniref:SMP-30/gluconolactonase/LRE family protein n=1 Tax=Teichococcus cervicalis TaxID=204525 RepID=UPI0022F1B41E|nr:SMP-30/gluconolactonase/LRE family protein [Pseudoroseomonas cervicalis]WBV43247.1 SMP-30/gluconolactonase/LRE family protein [Pseudoroseomonas cervicalis]